MLPQGETQDFMRVGLNHFLASVKALRFDKPTRMVHSADTRIELHKYGDGGWGRTTR